MAREEKSGNGCGGSSSSTILQFVPFNSLAGEGFWHRLSSLKLNKYGIDDSLVLVMYLIFVLLSTSFWVFCKLSNC
jgi:hypothetical protein